VFWFGKNDPTKAPIVCVKQFTKADQIRVTELLEKVFGKFVDSDQKRATFNEKIAESTIRGQGCYEFTATHDLVMEYRACNGNRETFNLITRNVRFGSKADIGPT